LSVTADRGNICADAGRVTADRGNIFAKPLTVLH
jgi:hypothetical protein